jgi:hypothetical protein
VGATGKTTLDFGAFPGGTEAATTITGQTGIVAGSLVEAWILPEDTVEHSSDEHLLDPPRVLACEIVAGTGFTIRGIYDAQFPVPGGGSRQELEERKTGPRRAPTCHGLWSVAWVWN